MYLLVFACTQDEHNFDGQIILERVSRAKVLTYASKNQTFTEYLYINKTIKKEEWRQFIGDSMTVDKLKVKIQNKYSLDGFVA